MKPAMLLDRLTYWQKLLDRAISTRPTGAAKTNRLILISLYAIVQETFDLYRDISDGLALLLDSFFHLQYQSCVNAFQACVRASKQFEELSDFFSLCKSLGVGRTSEYPSVQKISDELIETLQEFLKDQASFPGRSPTQSPLPSLTAKDFGSTSEKGGDGYEISESASETGSRCTSLEDLMSATGTSPSTSVEEIYSEKLERQQEIERDFIAGGDDSRSDTETPLPVNDQQSRSSDFDFDFFSSFDQWPDPDQEQKQEKGKEMTTEFEEDGGRNGWELVLVETAKQPETSAGFQSGFPDDLFGQSSFTAQNQYNPFLQDSDYAPAVTTAIPASSAANSDSLGGFFSDDWFAFPSTPQSSKEISNSIGKATAAPSFLAQNATVPNFFSENSSAKTTMAPTFFAQNSSQTPTKAPSFFEQKSREKAAMAAPSFFEDNRSERSSAPKLSSNAQNGNEASKAPTFCSQSPMKTTTTTTGLFNENDPFGALLPVTREQVYSGSGNNQQSLVYQQQLWLENQNKIIAKRS